MRELLIRILCLVVGGWVGYDMHANWHGDVRIFHNVDEGTALNHGQLSVDVTLPSGVVIPDAIAEKMLFNPHLFGTPEKAIGFRSFSIEEDMFKTKAPKVDGLKSWELLEK